MSLQSYTLALSNTHTPAAVSSEAVLPAVDAGTFARQCAFAAASDADVAADVAVAAVSVQKQPAACAVVAAAPG